MLNKIIKTLVYLAIFLIPIFFLPITVFPLMWNKHILLLFLCSLALILWLAQIIKQGKLNLKWNKLSTTILILLFVLIISTVFSSARVFSFWSAVSSQSCLNFILYFIIFFLASNVFNKNKDIVKALLLLLISSVILNLLFLIQLFFGQILPWDFSQAIGFNLIGSVWTFAIFLGGIIIILTALLGETKIFKNKFYKLLGCLSLILFLISLIIIDFEIAWIGIALSMIIIMWQKLKDFVPEKKVDLKSVYLPALIFVLAVVLIVIKLPLADRFQLPNLITLNIKTSHNIAVDSFKDSFKNIIIGSGPATFEYQYALHKPISIVQSSFWQTRFLQGKYALSTFLTEFGIFGLVGFLLIILFFLQQGIKKIILAKKESINLDFKTQVNIQSAVFASGFYFLLCWFLYSADFVLLFVSFLILGLWLACNNNKQKEIIFTKSPQQAFFIMLISIVIIPSLAICLFYSSKKYIANINYNKVIAVATQENASIDSAINFLIKAVNQDKANDLYLRELSEAYLIKLVQMQYNQQLSPEQIQQETQSLIKELDLLAQKMTQVNPQNSQNWEQLGRIYGSLMQIDLTAYEFSINNYIKASELDPKNPLILLKLASLNFEMAKNVLAQSKQQSIKQEDKNKLQEIYKQSLDSALEYSDKSIKLKNNFVSSYYLKALMYDFSEQYELALENYQRVLLLEPNNQEVLKRAEEIFKIINPEINE